jgi:type II secretory pathway pseudopilin PulG
MKFIKKNKTRSNVTAGYTLIELTVAVGLFVTVTMISSSAFLGVVSSNKKTLAVRTATTNLNFALESMMRNLETGRAYHCGSSGTIDAPRDCPDNNVGDSYLAFEGQRGGPLSGDQHIYRLGAPAINGCTSPRQICFSANGGTTFSTITDPAVIISALTFRVYGAPKNDSPSPPKQPRVTIVIKGSFAGSDFGLQTTISQRLPDYP